MLELFEKFLDPFSLCLALQNHDRALTLVADKFAARFCPGGKNMVVFQESRHSGSSAAPLFHAHHPRLPLARPSDPREKQGWPGTLQPPLAFYFLQRNMQPLEFPATHETNCH
jgi:hypothetical protein